MRTLLTSVVSAATAAVIAAFIVLAVDGGPTVNQPATPTDGAGVSDASSGGAPAPPQTLIATADETAALVATSEDQPTIDRLVDELEPVTNGLAAHGAEQHRDAPPCPPTNLVPRAVLVR